MQDSSASRPACYSVRLLRPFVLALRATGRVPEPELAVVERLDPEARIPIADAHAWLAKVHAHVRDPDLGLKAAQQIGRGDVGATDYLLGSLPTVRAALAAASRSTRLLNDALVVELLEPRAGGEATLRLESRVPLARLGVDFVVAGFYRAHVSVWLRDVVADVAICFRAAPRASIEEHERTFAPAQLRFAQPFDGFAFPAELLDTPLPTADPNLHAVLARATEPLLAALPPTATFADHVRALVEQELAEGNPTALNIATRLGTSERTLARRLESEGQTFKALLDGLRQELALRLVRDATLDLAEVARRLGFSQTTAFHRAFRRWTGHTPLELRALGRGARGRSSG